MNPLKNLQHWLDSAPMQRGVEAAGKVLVSALALGMAVMVLVAASPTDSTVRQYIRAAVDSTASPPPLLQATNATMTNLTVTGTITANIANWTATTNCAFNSVTVGNQLTSLIASNATEYVVTLNVNTVSNRLATISVATLGVTTTSTENVTTLNAAALSNTYGAISGATIGRTTGTYASITGATIGNVTGTVLSISGSATMPGTQTLNGATVQFIFTGAITNDCGGGVSNIVFYTNGIPQSRTVIP